MQYSLLVKVDRPNIFWGTQTLMHATHTHTHTHTWVHSWVHLAKAP